MKKKHLIFFLISIPNRLGIEGIYLICLKGFYEFSRKILKVFPLRLGIRQRCSITTFILHWTGCPDKYNQTRKKDAKCITNGKEKNKISLSENNIIVEIQKNLPKSYENYWINLVRPWIQDW